MRRPLAVLLSLTLAASAMAEDGYYSDADLKIGDSIMVFNRPLLLCDCDAFTKQHYETKLK